MHVTVVKLSQLRSLGDRVYALMIQTRFQLGSLALLFYFAYADTFKELWHYWTEGYNWQFIIPIAFLYMLWDRSDLVSGLKREPNIFWGALLLSLACATLIAGQVSSTHSLREISIVLCIFALVLLLFGSKYVRNLFWPLAYLVLMTSLAGDLLGTLRDPLKLLSATVAADMLQFGGYAVFRDGTFLQLPHITLEVADSCSGLNQLISAIALGIPIAFTVVNQWWKRVTILLVSVVFGLIMNWIRVFLISIWHYSSAKETVHGPYGLYELPFIFLVGVVLTFVVALALADKRQVAHNSNQHAASSDGLNVDGTGNNAAAYLVAVVVLVTTAVYLNFWKVDPVYLRDGFSHFPLTIAGFQGKPISELEAPFYSDLAHDELILQYANTAGITAKVYVGYFHSQNQEHELIDYRYDWLHGGARVIDFPASTHPFQMKMNRVKTKTGLVTVYFCYDVNGRILIDPVTVKLASLVDALLRGRANGAIIIIQVDGDLEDFSVDTREFVNEVVIAAQASLQTNDRF